MNTTNLFSQNRWLATLRVLYHMARADFLERTRRYSFLIMLALVLWLGYLSASGQFRMRVPPDYLGIINSAWVGATMTITVTLLLGWIGFYLVKGSVSRDYETGVGQIIATTPLSRPLYMLGKWFSNFVVLGLMILILMVVGIMMNLFAGTPGFNLWAIIAPLLFIAMPCMAMVAAMAVLFEAIHWLRGGLGNVVYFFVFLFALVASVESLASPSAANRSANPLIDFAGFQLIGDSVSQAAKAAYPESMGGFAFSITELTAPKMFLWNGIEWTAEVIMPRFIFMLISMGIVLLAAVFFDRFNPTRNLPAKRKQTKPKENDPEIPVNAIPVSSVRLTPFANAQRRFRFDALFMAELKLFLKGQHWWWYAVAVGLITAQWFNELEVTRLLLVISWTWPILMLSTLGCRESRYDTRQIVFSAPRPLLNQLPAAWLAAFTVLAVMGSGALVRFILAGETISILGWATGILFIPSLALASGILTGSSKTFEVLYVLWMYMLTQKAALFDFIGMTPASPWYIYVPLAAVLLILAVIARRRQLTTGGFLR